ncbi:uncharacterized protein MONOS_17484 [Monocercomonoides exilis]|uniref:uncharacterized protein n=1 Tax=Monocercomonoides exilis TaxID=2049356 RepID=UPI003559C474|nr:hypothetical protein MONOS_17484 [Monocercomonoides exilis]
MNFWTPNFDSSSLYDKFEEILNDEEKKQEEKNEKLEVDICECILSLHNKNYDMSSDFLLICIPCLLNFVIAKEENEEARNEVEMALLSLSSISQYCEYSENELCLNKLAEIIKHHQVHQNLTPLAYLSAFRFFMNRVLGSNNSLKEHLDELHFVKEVTKQLEELTKCIDWKQKKNGVLNTKEVRITKRWCKLLYLYFLSFTHETEEITECARCIIRLCKTAKDNYSEVTLLCVELLNLMIFKDGVNVDDLLRVGAVELILDEIHQPTLGNDFTETYLSFFSRLSKRLNRNANEKSDKEKSEIIKRVTFSVLEEDGYEDSLISFNEMLRVYMSHYVLPKNPSELFVVN